MTPRPDDRMPRPRGLVRSVLSWTILIVAPWALAASATDTDPSRTSTPPGDADARYERLETTWHFESNGTGWIERSGRVRIATATGRDAFGQIIVPFDAERDEVAFDYVRTVKPDGTTVASDLSRTFEQSPISKSPGTNTTSRRKVVPVADLAPGDALEWRFTTRILHPSLPGNFSASYLPHARLAVEQERVSLDVPADRPVALHYDADWIYKVEESQGRRVHVWSHGPQPGTQAPRAKPVFIVTTFPDWERMGAWAAAMFDEASRTSPEIEALARRLTEGRDTDTRRLEALYGYVSTRIRYLSLPFNDHALKPHAAAQVLQSGYGDCKDKAVLLVALCRSLKMQASPVLARLGYDLIDAEIPSPEQFNHAFVAVDLPSGTVWLDPTSGSVPFATTSAALRGRQVLRLDAPAARVVRVPEAAGTQQARVKCEGEVDASGTLALKVHVEARGDLEILLRLAFRAGGEDARRGVVQTLAELLASGSTVSDIKGSDPLNLDTPFSVDFTVRRPGYVSSLEKRATLALPSVAPVFLQEIGAQAQAILLQFLDTDTAQPEPPRVPYPGMDVEERLSLALPSTVVELPLPVSTDTPEATYRSTYEVREGRIEVMRKFTIKPSPKQAAALDHVRQLAMKDASQTAVLQRPQGDAQAAVASLSADQLVEMASASLSRGEAASAQRALEAAVAKEPGHASAWFALAQAYAVQERWNDAINAAKRQIETNPYHKDA